MDGRVPRRGPGLSVWFTLQSEFPLLQPELQETLGTDRQVRKLYVKFKACQGPRILSKLRFYHLKNYVFTPLNHYICEIPQLFSPQADKQGNDGNDKRVREERVS